MKVLDNTTAGDVADWMVERLTAARDTSPDTVTFLGDVAPTFVGFHAEIAKIPPEARMPWLKDRLERLGDNHVRDEVNPMSCMRQHWSCASSPRRWRRS